MSDKQDKKPKKLLKVLFVKLPIFLSIIGLLMIISLKMVERFPEPLREGFQQYLSEAYQTQATIGSLDEISFVPRIDIKAQDIKMHNNVNAAIIDMELKSILIKAPLWSMMLNRGYVDNINIKDLSAKEGFLLPRRIKIETMEIINRDGPDQYGSFLVASGEYNQKVMTFEAELEKTKKHYKIGNHIPFSLTIGDRSLNAQMHKTLRTVELNSAVFSSEENSTPAQNFTVYKNNQFTKDNPLYCMLQDNGEDCRDFTQE